MKQNTNPESALDKRVLIRALLAFLVYMLIHPAILFISAGTLDWSMAWILSITAIVLTVHSRIAARRANPDLLKERAQYAQVQDVKGWDRVLVPLVGLWGPMVMMLVAGLDKRFGWSSQIPLVYQFAALGVAILGFLLGTWAMVANRYFSAVVRIQHDREHAVCTDGPYRHVRHPGYAGAIVYYLAIPVILSSWWTFIPALAVILLISVRTALEDRTLQEELNGYAAYAQRVHYRLLPGIW
jgi:protein-S-isoprenylcysteine O-methyltransferase Ste14